LSRRFEGLSATAHHRDVGAELGEAKRYRASDPGASTRDDGGTAREEARAQHGGIHATSCGGSAAASAVRSESVNGRDLPVRRSNPTTIAWPSASTWPSSRSCNVICIEA